jgi:hypothetical protein
MMFVKRLQIMIEEELDEALTMEGRRTGQSKAALIRACVRAALLPDPGAGNDPLDSLAGAFDFEPADVDDVVYR